MKHLYLNLKRFDVPTEYGGVNSLAPIYDWGSFIIESTQDALKKYEGSEVEFVQFFPEAHILSAATKKQADSPIKIGCQGVHSSDTAVGGNFGAFTTFRPASAAKALGCDYVLIGHCEQRSFYNDILKRAGVNDTSFTNRILNEEILQATERGLSVLYCIGEKAEEQPKWQEILGKQLDEGLAGVDKSKVVIAYEPVWSIGPGKTPADKDYITMIAQFVKERTGDMDVVYGGGLKKDNAAMLASIDEIDGGLIALTRFTGEIGWYPDEYLDIICTYLGK